MRELAAPYAAVTQRSVQHAATVAPPMHAMVNEREPHRSMRRFRGRRRRRRPYEYDRSGVDAMACYAGAPWTRRAPRPAWRHSGNEQMQAAGRMARRMHRHLSLCRSQMRRRDHLQ